MAEEIGVLELTIQDNADKAGQGLNQLAKALGAVKSNAAGFSLSNVQQEIKNIVDSVKGSEKTTAALGALFNAVANFSKAKITNIDVSPIEELKAALGTEGIKIGNAGSQLSQLRTALEGKWNMEGAEAAGQALSTIVKGASDIAGKDLGTIAENVNKVADALRNYADASSTLMGILGGGNKTQSQVGMNMPLGSSGKKIGLQFFGGKGETNQAEQMKMDLDGLLQTTQSVVQQMNEGMSGVASSIQDANSANNEFLQTSTAITEQVQMTADAMAELVKQSQEANKAKTQALLEKSYDQYRDLWLNGGDEGKEISETRYGFTPRAFEEGQTYAEALRITLEEVNRYVDEFIEKANQPGGELLRDVIDQAREASLAYKSAEESAEVLRNAPVVSESMQPVESATQTMSSSFTGATQKTTVLTESLEDLDSELKSKQGDFSSVSDAAGNTSASFSELMFGAQGLHGAFGRMFPTLSGMVSRLGRLATMRALRYIIREVAAGIREGTENMYQYSAAIGSSLAPAMDSVSASLAQFKNSIGAAAAPIINALVPALQTVIGWLVQAINLLNQFFALLGGQATWTRALQTETKALNDTKKAAGGAGGAMKDLLADWDELNIIQSQSGGGGGGGGGGALGADYANMFEEVGEFTGWVKDLVDGIKDQFGDIWNLVKKIGVTLLGWKIASAFEGIIGKLGGLLAALGIIDLVFNIVMMFDNNYLKTGEEGWLIADLLTTIVGSHFMSVVLDKVLGGGAGVIGIPLVFTVSAAASIAANLSHTDVSALSEKSIKTSLLAALKGGVAAGYLAHIVAGTLGSTLLGGAVGAIATFGIAVALKADAQVSAEGITEENVKAALLGIGSLGIAGAATGAKLAEAAGVSVGAAAAGMAMLFSGAAITTLGVAVGIHAINTTVEAGEITKEVIEENLLASGIIGTGLALVAGATIGSGLAVGIVAVGGAALALAVLFGIEGTIAEKAKVSWGNYEATKEEIETFVNDSLYKDPPDVTISLINATIEQLDESKSKLSASAEKVIGTIYAARVGILTTKEDLKTQVDQLVADFNNASEQYQNTLQVALSLVPVKNKDGSDASADIIKRSSGRWSELNGIMTKLGEDLANAYSVAYDARMNGAIDEDAEQTIQKISEMMTRVAEAISGGQAKAKAAHAIMTAMQDLSQGTLDGILQVYREQQDKLMEEMTKVREDAAEGLLAQAYAYDKLAEYALKDAGGDVTNAKYLDYKQKADQARADYKTTMDGIKKDVERETAHLLDTENEEKLRQQLLDMIVKPIEKLDYEQYLANAFAGDPEVFAKSLVKTLSGINGKDINNEVSSMFDMLLMELVGTDNFDTYKGYIDIGILKWSDLFNKEFVNKLGDTLLGPDATNEMKQKWRDAVTNVFGSDFFAEGEAKKAASNTVDNVREQVEEAAQSAPPVKMKFKGTPMVESIDEIKDIVGDKSVKEMSAGAFNSQIYSLRLGYDQETVKETADSAMEDAKKVIEDSAKTADPIEVDAEIKVNTVFIDEVREAIEDAVAGAKVDLTDSANVEALAGKLYGQFGAFYNLDDIKNYINQLVEQKEGLPGTSGSMGTAWRTSASAGGSSRNYSRYNAPETTGQEAEPIDYNQMANSVKSGTSQANVNVISELQVIANRLSALLAKNWTVNINATSSLGAVNSKASAAWDKVTG